MRILSALLVACLLSAFDTAAATELTISHQFPAETDNRDRAARLFVKEVQARVPNMAFVIHPMLSLKLKAEEQFAAVGDGRIDMAAPIRITPPRPAPVRSGMQRHYINPSRRQYTTAIQSATIVTAKYTLASFMRSAPV